MAHTLQLQLFPFSLFKDFKTAFKSCEENKEFVKLKSCFIKFLLLEW